jgi:hypothetical protein
VVARSDADGSLGLDTSIGISSRILFSSLPDRAGMCEMAFQIRFTILAPGWTVHRILRVPEYFPQLNSEPRPCISLLNSGLNACCSPAIKIACW